MSAETDLIWEKFLKENDQPDAVIGETYIYKGVEYTYKEDSVPIIELVDNYPQLIHKENCLRILNYEQPKTTQTIDENVRIYLLQSLATNTLTGGATKPDIANLMAAASVASAVSGVTGAAATLEGISNIAGNLGNIGNLGDIAGNIGNLGNIAGNIGNLGNIAGQLGNLGDIAGQLGNLGGLAGQLGNLGDIAGNIGNLGGLAGQLGNLGGLAGQLGDLGGLAGQLGNLGGLAGLAGAAPMLQGLQNLPIAGLDKAIENVKKQIKETEKKLPFKTGKASDITAKINEVVQNVIPTDVKGVASIIFSVIKSNLMAGIPDGGTTNPSGAGSRLADEARKLVAAAPNKSEYEAQFKSMAREFPEININAVALQAAQMVKTGNPNSFASAFPNMIKLAGGLMSLLGAIGKHPEKLPQKEQKTKPAPKPKPLVQPKNLFAAAAGASSMGTLMGTVSSLMGIVSTVAGNLNQMSPSPQLTSAGPQKLTGTANTATWGSGQFSQPQDAQLALINKELELITKIEQLTAEILADVDLEKITSKSMAEILEIYPQYNEGTTVIELYQAILDYEKKNGTMTA